MDSGFDPPAGGLVPLLDHIWRQLVRGVRDRRSGFHAPALATISADGAPSVRTVVLRAADPARRQLRFHTDIRARKFEELGRDPRASALFYDAPARTQIRVEGHAAVECGTERAAAVFRAMRPMSQACYRAPAGPGSAAAEEALPPLDDAAAMENFALIELRVLRIDWLYLRHQGHQRAHFAFLGDGTVEAERITP